LPLRGDGHPPPDFVAGVRGPTAPEEAREHALAFGAKLLIPLGLAISVIAHVAFLTPAVYFAGANPFDTMPADAITVDIVSEDESGEAPKPADAAADATPSSDTKTPDPKTPDFRLPDMTPGLRTADAPPAAPAAAPAEPPPQPQPQPPPAARALPQSAARQAAAQPQPASSAPSPAPSWLPQLPPQLGQAEPEPAPPQTPPPETDITNMFAMPLTLPDGKVGGKYDSQSVEKANVEDDSAAAFRSHLKTCSALPAGVAPEVKVVLRIYLKPDGSLAAGIPQNPEPIKVEGVSRGGGALFQSAVAALRKCQPYKMLPPDKYEEWKRLDLTFTPQNF
jgi:hypothetical protein